MEWSTKVRSFYVRFAHARHADTAVHSEDILKLMITIKMYDNESEELGEQIITWKRHTESNTQKTMELIAIILETEIL